ncbi:YoaK family protein [Flavobacterium sp. ACN6]|uniref:YoaK family protein n=1 Tax=Flavobacterium sp. ACN6 TaxID=1920426 RepID=UPI00155469B7|nr:YoaK family protein [Flavobacterium sp. ACN6]PBJ05447.1 hypothetical protein BSF42_43140 [Flavobacterium sp. ACN6]
MTAETDFNVSSEQIRIQEKLAVFLALTAGYLDAVGILKWKIYVSFMSGNTTQLGISLSNGKASILITTCTAIVCFMLGIFAGTCLSLSKDFKMPALPFYIVSGILIMYTAINQYYTIHTLVSIAVIGFSTGVMNTIVTAVGSQKINTDFVTGTLNSLAANAAQFSLSSDQKSRKQYKINVIRLTLLWIGFISGAFTAPLVIGQLGKWTLMLPAITLLICAVLLPIKEINLKTKSYAEEK